MNPRPRTIWRRALDALASLKLSLFLFLFLASTSVFGTVIQQQGDPRAYAESYGPILAAVFRALNLVDMYHSWWFELLLALLLANTLVCSLRRFPAALRAIRRDQFQGETELGRKKFRASWNVRDGAEEGVAEVLTRSFGRPRFRQSDEGVSWFVQRQGWARLGPYVAHASLVLFFLGGIVGARYGFKGFANIVEGQSVGAVQLRNGQEMRLPFEVECEKFDLQTYPDGRPKDYLSKLVVRRNGRVVQEKTIQVNDPLVQDGIHFYQSSYGKTAGDAVLKVFDRSGKLLADGLRVPEKAAVPIPGTGLSVELAAAQENLDGFGPAAQLVLVPEGPTDTRTWASLSWCSRTSPISTSAEAQTRCSSSPS